jgi:hemerythrin
MLVPWTYYQSARYRYRQIRSYSRKYTRIKKELRQHEFVGLVLVCASPIVGGYILQYSRYLLSSADKYVSNFNVTVFIIGAAIKPITHAITLLSQGTLFLQSNHVTTTSKMDYLQHKLSRLQNELQLLKLAHATKQDLGEATNEISPALTELSTTLNHFDQREEEWRNETDFQFKTMEEKVHEFDQFRFYRLQRQQETSFLIQLIQLPIQFSTWLSEQTSF